MRPGSLANSRGSTQSHTSPLTVATFRWIFLFVFLQVGLGDVTCTSAGYIITIVQCDIYTGMCNVYRRVIYVDDSIVVMVLAIV